MTAHPYRSVLYIPAARPRALEKAKTLAVDAIIFDLEDAVAVAEKPQARDLLRDTLMAGGYGKRAQLARINGLDTPWGLDDVATLAAARPQVLLLPKVNGAADIAALSNVMDSHDGYSDTKIWAMMESPLGILNAAEIAAAPRMGGMVMGTNDLAKDLGTRTTVDRAPLQASLSHCVLAARAAGIAVVDGVYNAFKDADGLRIEADQGRDFGFDGKTLIHPAQVEVANEAFAPSEDDLDLATRQITAFEAAVAQGQGVAVVDGSIVEYLHVETARGLIAKAQTIAELSA